MRLLPLLFLPVVGTVVGALMVQLRGLPSGPQLAFDTAVAALTGLVGGSFLMALIALGFLAVRVGTRRFTIRSILIAVAAIALGLGLLRACVP